jgi:hypothetical protein
MKYTPTDPPIVIPTRPTEYRATTYRKGRFCNGPLIMSRSRTFVSSGKSSYPLVARHVTRIMGTQMTPKVAPIRDHPFVWLPYMPA